MACFFYLQLGSQRLEDTQNQKTRISVQTVAEGCKCPKSSRTRLSTTIVYQMVPRWTLKPKPWGSPPELSTGAFPSQLSAGALRRSSSPELFAGALRFQGAGSRFRVSGLGFERRAKSSGGELQGLGLRVHLGTIW